MKELLSSVGSGGGAPAAGSAPAAAAGGGAAAEAPKEEEKPEEKEESDDDMVRFNLLVFLTDDLTLVCRASVYSIRVLLFFILLSFAVLPCTACSKNPLRTRVDAF